MSFIMTQSGQRFYPEHPERHTFLIEDIARALSRECRYGGHATSFYSVAQHSVHCSELVSPENALCALLHDATEAYLKDIPKPLKAILGSSYTTLEGNLWKAIAKQYEVPEEMPKEVHEADKYMMKLEILAGIPPAWEDKVWHKYLADTYRPANGNLILGLWTDKAAEQAFLRRYWELTRNRKAA